MSLRKALTKIKNFVITNGVLGKNWNQIIFFYGVFFQRHRWLVRNLIKKSIIGFDEGRNSSRLKGQSFLWLSLFFFLLQQSKDRPAVAIFYLRFTLIRGHFSLGGKRWVEKGEGIPGNQYLAKGRQKFGVFQVMLQVYWLRWWIYLESLEVGIEGTI